MGKQKKNKKNFKSLGEANGETKKKTKKTLLLRAPLVAIGAQKTKP